MVSRVAHVVLLDIIVTSIALRGGAALQDRLRAAKNSLADLRIPSAGDGAAAKRRRVNANGRGGRRPAAGEEQDTP
jgi:RpiR family carbohydrate utilization transcriptional regulator